jgi:hypothetical protein
MLTLSISGLQLSIKKFTDNKLPRVIVEPYPNLEYSVYGTPVGDGPLFSCKYIWSISTILTIDECRVLGAIYQEFDTQRRNLESASITLIDTNQSVEEKSPRTRAIAPDTSAISLPNSYVSYYGQFYVWFTKPPDFQDSGRYRTVQFTLVESLKFQTV